MRLARLGAAVCVLAGCGRIGFDPTDASGDAWMPAVAALKNSTGVDVIRALATTPQGFVVGGGYDAGFAVDGTALPHVAGMDAFVLSLDRDAKLRWFATCASSDWESVSSATADADGNVYVGGFTLAAINCGGGPLPVNSYTAWMASFDVNGAYRWSHSFPSNVAAPGILLDSVAALTMVGGHVVAAGHVHGTVDFGRGPIAPAGTSYDGFVASFTPDGALEWARRFGGGAQTLVRGVASDAAANLFLTGEISSDIDFGGGSQAIRGSSDAFVASYSLAGAYRWSTLLGNAGSTTAHALVVGPDAAIHVVGGFDTSLTSGVALTSSGGSDGFLVALGLDGSPRDAVALRGPGCEIWSGVAIRGGELALVGTISAGASYGGVPLANSGGTDALTTTVGVDGTLHASWVRGGANDDEMNVVAATPGGLLMSGTTERPLGSACGQPLIYDNRDTFLEAIVR